MASSSWTFPESPRIKTLFRSDTHRFTLTSPTRRRDMTKVNRAIIVKEFISVFFSEALQRGNGRKTSGLNNKRLSWAKSESTIPRNRNCWKRGIKRRNTFLGASKETRNAPGARRRRRDFLFCFFFLFKRTRPESSRRHHEPARRLTTYTGSCTD